MTLNEYQLLAKRTCPSLYEDTLFGSYLDSAHMIYGMISEIPEITDALADKDYVNLGEELSDIMWYLANYCTFNNIKLQDIVIVSGAKDIYSDRSGISTVVYYIGELADIEKKELAYKKTYSYDKQVDILQNLLWHIIKAYRIYDIDVYSSLEKNINKLKVRFPDKFDEEKAINRDLNAERKELE